MPSVVVVPSEQAMVTLASSGMKVRAPGQLYQTRSSRAAPPPVPPAPGSAEPMMVESVSWSRSGEITVLRVSPTAAWARQCVRW